MQYAIGIELGDTRLRIAAVDRSGNVFSKQSMAMPAKSALAEEIEEYLQDLINETELDVGFCARWIGYTAAGYPDPNRDGVFLELPERIGALGKHSFGTLGAEESERGVVLLNSAQAALFAECRTGAAKNSEHTLLLRVGTLLQGAIALQREVYLGKNGCAGKLSHTWIPSPVQDAGETAIAPNDLLSEGALAGADHSFRSYKSLIDAAASGKDAARKTWREHVKGFASLIAGLSSFQNADLVLLDGPITASKDLLLKPLSEELRQILGTDSNNIPRLHVSELGSYGAAIGAAGFAIRHARPIGKGILERLGDSDD